MTPADRALLRSASAHVFVDGGVDGAARVELPDDAAHHVFRVLRVRDGDVVTVTDGAGRWVPCRALGDVLATDGEVRSEPAPDRVTIGCAIPKRDRPEWIVQKLTEMGVARIVLLHAERSVVRWDEGRAAKHAVKLGKVAVEALQQSRGVWLPAVEVATAAAAFLPAAVVAEPGGRPLTADDRTVAIGPEGGWTDGELALAADRVDLGSTILRVETAALAAAARVLLR